MPRSAFTSDAGLEPLDFAAIALYVLVTLGIAVWFGRRQKNVEDYFVGGRRMPWFAVGLSILGTLFSTLTYVGMPGETIKHGLGLLTGYAAVVANALVITLVWIPFYMRLRLTSAYEYLERRFSYGVRALGASLFILLRMGWMSMVIFAASMALDRVKGHDLACLPGPDIYWTIVLVGVLAALYTSMGGIQALIWTDVLQCLLLLAGVLLTIGYVAFADGTGPIDWWRMAARHAPRHTSPPFFSWDITVRVTIAFTLCNNFFWNICTHGSDQVVLQRYFSTPSLRSARCSYLVNACVDVTMVSLLALVGFALLTFYWKRPELLPEGMTALNAADKLFPHFLGHELPAGCAGLIISAFLCDAMQTLEAGVNSITAVATNDILPRLWPRRRGRTSDLMFARLAVVAVTALVTANSYAVAHLSQTRGLTIIDMMPKFFNMFAGPLAAMFFAGMFLPRCTSRSVIPAAAAGLAISVLWSWWRELFGTDYAPTIFLAIAVPCASTFLLAAFLGLFLESGGPHPGRAFSWRSVVGRIPLPEPAPAEERN